MENQRVTEAMQRTQVAKQKIPSVVEQVNANGSLSGMTQKDVATYLSGMTDRIATVLPKHLTAERIISMAATSIAKNPSIAQCTPASLLGGVMQASILGFPPVEALGYCYFVPYYNKKVGRHEVQFQIGYRGLTELARRSGKIKSVYAECVYEGDEFKVELGLNPKLEHKPKFESSKPLMYVYAVCHFIDGGSNFVVLSKAQIEKLRMRSPMQGTNCSGAWASDYDAMAKAKVLKQLAKYMPLNIDQQSALATDEAVLTPDNFQAGNIKIEDVEYAPIEETAEDFSHDVVIPE